MFKKKNDPLDVAINDVLSRMRAIGPNDDEYRQLVVYLDRLMSMKKERKPRFAVSPDTIAIVVGNLIAVLIITQYEKADVITTKAKEFMLKN